MQALIYNRANPQIVINSYPLTAALNIINTTSPSTQPVAQIGANPSDRLPLQINNTSTAGLNLNAINIATLPYAYIAQTYLQDALQFIASTINNINSQVTQLNARTNTITTQIDLLQDQIDAIENTDLTANATALADAKITVIIAGALMKLDATLKTTISASARKILIRPRG